MTFEKYPEHPPPNLLDWQICLLLHDMVQWKCSPFTTVLYQHFKSTAFAHVCHENLAIDVLDHFQFAQASRRSLFSASWTSAGSYFISITPSPSGMLHLRLRSAHNPKGRELQIGWFCGCGERLTRSHQPFQLSSSTAQTLQVNNRGAALQDGSGGRLRRQRD